MKIMNINMSLLGRKALESRLTTALKGSDTLLVGKINTEFLLRSIKEPRFAETLSGFGLNIPDGRGVQWAAKYLTLPLRAKEFRISNFEFLIALEAVWQMVFSGASIVLSPKYIRYPIPETFPGIEAFRLMLGLAEKEKVGIFLLGATATALSLSENNIRKEFPGLKISGSINGYDFQKDSTIDLVEIINKTDAKILFVCFGSPKQEYWLKDNIGKLENIKIAVGEGGTLDRMAYPVQAAPKWLNRIGLEWLWRLFMNKSKTETGSRVTRVWNAVPVFIYEVVKYKIKNGATDVKEA